jgi:hypothetical protein
MTERAFDLVHVAFHPGFTDGLPGCMFRDGRSVAPLRRYLADRLVARLGPPARVVEIESLPLAAEPVPPASPPSAGDEAPGSAPPSSAQPRRRRQP